MWTQSVAVVATLVAMAVVPLAMAESEIDLSIVKSEMSALEMSKRSLLTGVARLQTLLATAQERMNRIQYRDNGEVTARNRAQDNMMGSMKSQVSAAEQMAARTTEMATAADTLAAATAQDLPNLTDNVNSNIADNNVQSGNLSTLQGKVDAITYDTANAISAARDAVAARINTAAAAIDTIRAQQDSRSCETGFTSAGVPGRGTVTFTSHFGTPPVITLSTVGFSARLGHSYGYDSAVYTDIMGFGVAVDEADSLGFNFTVTETEDSAVHPKRIYVRYLACQNLDL